MGNTLSCCLCPNACRKRGRHSGSAESDYESEVYEVAPQDPVAVAQSPAALEPAELDFGAGEGNPAQQHSSDPEMTEDSALESNISDHSRASQIFLNEYQRDDLAVESNPPDHLRASSVFQSENQTDVQEKEKTHPEWTMQLTKQYSSCSTIFLDDSTARQPNLENTLNCVSLAICYLIKNRDGNTSLNIFDERSHPLTEEELPEEYSEDDPDPKLIYRFLHTLFSVTGLAPSCAIITWIYLERVFLYTKIDICPNNWKRIVLGAIFASITCDSQSLQNMRCCESLMDITVEDMDEIKKKFVTILKDQVTVSTSVYTKYYFDIHSMTHDDMICIPTPLTKQRAQKLEAISRLCEDDDYNDLCSAAMRRSLSADNVIVLQHSNAIIS